MSELTRLNAVNVVKHLRSGEVSPIELVDAAIARIEEVDGTINALPIRCFERARDQAAKLSNVRPADRPSPLLGMPIAVKDYNDVGGVLTTYGSPIFENNIAAHSDATVSRLEQNGAIPIAKSNVPEWAGGNTFNPVLGATVNPWDTRMTVGGSSGGSAAAIASGMVWQATGNDLGGSLRTPASFNGIVGMRPGPGRVPRGRRHPAYDVLWVEGPMARCISDVALMLDAAKGHDAADPLSFSEAGADYLAQLDREVKPSRVAFSRDLGVVPMAREIGEICAKVTDTCASIGVSVTEDIPDFTGAKEGFQTLRAVLLGTMMGPLLAEHRERIAPDIVGNVELGFTVTPEQLFEAERTRWQLFQRMETFFQTHDFLICPASSVEPFPVDQAYVAEIDGEPCETYIDWFAITFVLTMTSCPVVTIPCGFTKSGLPVGIQIVGRPRGEAALLNFAQSLERELAIAPQLPIDPRPNKKL